MAVLAVVAAGQGPPVRALVRTTIDDDLARRSAAAVRGIVQAVTVVQDAVVGAPYTHVTIAATRVWGFATPPQQVEIKLLGGAGDGDVLVVGGQARFVVGEEVLAFLDVRPRDQSLSVTGLERGKWTLGRSDGGTGHGLRRRESTTGDVATDQRSIADLEAMARRTGSEVRLPSKLAPPVGATGSAASVTAAPPSVDVTIGRWHEADWGVPIAVDSQAGGHPLFPGGGFGQLVRAIGHWSGRSPLRLQPGVARGPRCFVNSEAPDGRISISYGDPCDEIADTSPVAAIGGTYVSRSDVRVVSGIAYGRVTKGVVVLDNASAKFAAFSTGCYEELLTHELGHAIGLGHIDGDDAVMSPWLAPDCVNRLESQPLRAADLAALSAPYPTAAAVPGPPGTPSGVSAFVSGTNVRVVWRPSLGPAATSYQLAVGSLPGGADLGTITVTTPELSVSSVARGVYYVRAHATNEYGASVPSPEIAIVVGDGLPGAPVGLLAAAAMGGDVRVAWQAPLSGAAPTAYTLLVGTAPDRPTMRIPVATTSLSARGVPPGTYFVQAVAENDAGSGPASPQILIVVP
jgi:hypothetical protein